jgi:hypothetical protein
MRTKGGENPMKSAIRWLPAFAGTFLIGYYVGSPGFTQDARAAKYSVAVGIVVAVVIVTGLLCAITRSKNNQQQSAGFARARTGRN